MEVCYIEPKHSSTWSKNPTIWHCWAASQFSVISCHTVLLSVPRFFIRTNLDGCLYTVSISWMDTKCYDTFWGNWKFLVVDCFLFMKKLHDAWVCRIFYSQSICVYWYCDYSSVLWRLYRRSWAMRNYKQMPGNIVVQDIWWLLPLIVSHQNENHVTCLHHMAIQGLADIVKHFQILVSPFSTGVS